MACAPGPRARVRGALGRHGRRLAPRGRADERALRGGRGAAGLGRSSRELAARLDRARSAPARGARDGAPRRAAPSPRGGRRRVRARSRRRLHEVRRRRHCGGRCGVRRKRRARRRRFAQLARRGGLSVAVRLAPATLAARAAPIKARKVVVRVVRASRRAPRAHNAVLSPGRARRGAAFGRRRRSCRARGGAPAAAAPTAISSARARQGSANARRSRAGTALGGSAFSPRRASAREVRRRRRGEAGARRHGASLRARARARAGAIGNSLAAHSRHLARARGRARARARPARAPGSSDQRLTNERAFSASAFRDARRAAFAAAPARAFAGGHRQSRAPSCTLVVFPFSSTSERRNRRSNRPKRGARLAAGGRSRWTRRRLSPLRGTRSGNARLARSGRARARARRPRRRRRTRAIRTRASRRSAKRAAGRRAARRLDRRFTVAGPRLRARTSPELQPGLSPRRARARAERRRSRPKSRAGRRLGDDARARRCAHRDIATRASAAGVAERGARLDGARTRDARSSGATTPWMSRRTCASKRAPLDADGVPDRSALAGVAPAPSAAVDGARIMQQPRRRRTDCAPAAGATGSAPAARHGAERAGGRHRRAQRAGARAHVKWALFARCPRGACASERGRARTGGERARSTAGARAPSSEELVKAGRPTAVPDGPQSAPWLRRQGGRVHAPRRRRLRASASGSMRRRAAPETPRTRLPAVRGPPREMRATVTTTEAVRQGDPAAPPAGEPPRRDRRRG